MNENHDQVQPRSNEELINFRKKHFLPTAGFYHKEPIQLTKAQGTYVWDSEGKRYFDAIGGIVCISAGHNHPKIKKALIEAIEKDVIQHTSLLYLNQAPIDTAEQLLEEAPNNMNRVSFTNSGSEANELAIMAARHATGETMVVNVRHSYHGGTSAALASCGHSIWRFKGQPVTGVTSALEPYCYRCPFKQKPESCDLECAKNVETTIQNSTHGKIAAFILEPVMGVGGFITPPDAYFDEVAHIVHNYGGKYISDEVQTGAGRGGGDLLLTKTLNIDADMVTMAKGFGNGAPVGAVLMKNDIAETMAGKTYFNTFAGDPLQMIQAKLTLEIIKEEQLVENARIMGELLKDGLQQLQKKYPLIGDVRGRGLLLGIELVKNQQTKTPASDEAFQLMDLCKDKGLLVGKGGQWGNVFRIAPPLTINREEINFIIETIDQSLSELSRMSQVATRRSDTTAAI
ncbi:aspartate aminotransferase family protein [Legionella maioricensis]|uniref:alanine--glyoxylate transaminase n=1 Tax=Legionella maioricensis TaxID=2896528 RepID=A0A9X2D1W7_9GAMM|nr:aspartate aminotransferase family protein [Legionella maioricensis]MCL9684901.1 aspartate aminotransferase family protein [Legionella maioricensis]MCL9688267.1 aspartate aminotransferase family protein [Legionella maioricensis]